MTKKLKVDMTVSTDLVVFENLETIHRSSRKRDYCQQQGHKLSAN